MIRRCFHQKKILRYSLLFISLFSFPHTLFAASQMISIAKAGDGAGRVADEAPAPGSSAPAILPPTEKASAPITVTPTTPLLKLKKEGFIQPKKAGFERLSPKTKKTDGAPKRTETMPHKKIPKSLPDKKTGAPKGAPKTDKPDRGKWPSQSTKQKGPSTSSSKKTPTRDGSKKTEAFGRQETKGRKTPTKNGLKKTEAFGAQKAKGRETPTRDGLKKTEAFGTQPAATERLEPESGALSGAPLDMQNRNVGATPSVTAPTIATPPPPAAPVQPPIFVAPQ